MNEDDRKSKRRFWFAHVAAWEQSGLTQTAYCREYSLSRDVFWWWRRKFRDRPTVELPVLVKVPSTIAPAVSSPGDFSGLRLMLSRGLRVEISQGFDAMTLSRVVATLEVGQ